VVSSSTSAPSTNPNARRPCRSLPPPRRVATPRALIVTNPCHCSAWQHSNGYGKRARPPVPSVLRLGRGHPPHRCCRAADPQGRRRPFHPWPALRLFIPWEDSQAFVLVQGSKIGAGLQQVVACPHMFILIFCWL
jgi:hypothetical protein